jgi:hypothetical protein
MMLRLISAIAFTAVAGWAGSARSARLISVRIEPQSRMLRGAGASQQLLVTGTLSDGTEQDLTEQAAWRVSDSKLGRISAAGRLFALGDGDLTVTVVVQSRPAKSVLHIEDTGVERPFSFARDIGGIFTRRGCNSTACHGSVKGRGGFKLSSSAANPKEDYEWIMKGGVYQVLTDTPGEPRTPRVDLRDAAKSLLLLKPSMAVSHGGGLRLPKDSGDFQTILRWVQDGAPYGRPKNPGTEVVSLEVAPRLVIFPAGGRQQLLVTARMADGTREDYTHEVAYEVLNREVAKISGDGVVSGLKPSETPVLVRAAGLAASALIGVSGPRVGRYPKVPESNFIDEQVFSKLRRLQIIPSGLSTDSEFLRRACLDLAGTLPPTERVREFTAAKDPRKREKLVETLIASPEFVDYWTFRFSDLFRVAVFSNGISPKWSEMYWDWVRDSMARNKAYDQMARERLVAQGYDGATRHYLPYAVLSPRSEIMAEQVRVFMGRRLDCAQCHNHPYEGWTQDQFWGLAAFFDRMFILSNTLTDSVIFDHPVKEDLGSADVKGSIKLLHPRNKTELLPALLNGAAVVSGDHVNPRREFAAWMTSHPYFAEAAVNRVWSWFFGRGLVEPVDDFRSTNPATHPELLEQLAADFRDHGHDLRRLMRLIANSRTYQLSAVPNESNKNDQINYSHAIPRPLDAEVLLDAISAVTGVPEVFEKEMSEGKEKRAAQAPVGTRAINLHEPDVYFSRFLDLYGRPNRLTVPERNPKANLGQALDMLAGSTYNAKLIGKASRLARLLEPGTPDAGIVEEFYLAALSRSPTAEESSDLLKLIAQRGSREEGLKDFIWALISSREFAENH